MIETLAKKALTILKLKYGIPKYGFIAGGSLANIIWQLKSGNKAIINDVDIFIHSDPGTDTSSNSIFTYEKIQLDYLDPYRQIRVDGDNSYSIKCSTNDGIFNEIRYESKNKSPQLIIDSFDINCTQIGYSIEENKFYWSNKFEEFISTGNLEITNINTPTHTAIRLAKKKKELNANLSEFEFGLCQYAFVNVNYFADINRVKFKDKYANSYLDNKDILDRHFKLVRDTPLEEYLEAEKKVTDKIYTLSINGILIISFDDILPKDPIARSKIDVPGMHSRITDSKEFMFYIRNIYKNSHKQNIWNRLYFFYSNNEYINENESDIDIDFLSELSFKNPSMIDNLKGMTFREQLNVIKTVMEKITEYHDEETALAVLQHIKLSPDYTFDEDECLLMGLSVRKKVEYKEDKKIDLDLDFI